MEQYLVQNQTKVKLESFWQQCMQMSTYTLFQLIPRMEHLLQSSEEKVNQYKSAVEALEETEKERIAQIKKEIADTTSQLLKTMEEKFIHFIERMSTEIQQSADY